MESFWLKYILFFITSVIVSLLLNGILLRFSKTLGMRNPNDTIMRWNNQVKPSLGGISFYVLFLLSISSYSFIFHNSAIFSDKQLSGMVGVCSMAFFMGLADDAYNTKPVLKFLVQVLCAVVLIITGNIIQIFPIMYLNYAFTILWVVGMMNSLNMLDNMDAITATVSINIILSALMVLYLNNGIDHVNAWLLIGLMGTLFGFLYFNWNPSKLFMGDTGSQFLGVFLATIGIHYLWNSADASGNVIQSKQFYVTILTFLIPIVDTTIVVINRISRGKSPFIGGKDHTTHHISYLGLSDRKVAIIFAALSFLSMLGTFFITKYINDWGYTHIILFGIYFLTLFGVLFYITRTTKPKIENVKKAD